LRDAFRAPHPDLNLDARAQAVDDRHEAIDREPPEVRIADAREVGRRNASTRLRGANSQLFPIERLDDFGREQGLELFGIGSVVPQIAEHIAASSHHLGFFSFHRFPVTGNVVIFDNPRQARAI